MALQVLDPATKDKLTEQIERLAMLLVTGDLSGSEAGAESESPETLAHLQAAADAVYASARSAGFTEAVELVSDLKNSLAAAKNPKQDRVALEGQLQTGITRLQAAVAQAGVAGTIATTEQRGPEAVPQPVESRPSLLSSSALSQDPELVGDFLMESGEHLSTIESQLLTIEQDPANMDALNSIFRAFHTIKGLAGFLEFSAVQESAHEVETLLDKARNRELVITPPVVDVILEGADHLKTWMQYISSVLSGTPEEEPKNGHPLHERIRRYTMGAQPQAPEAATSDLATLFEAVIAEAAPVASAAPSENIETPGNGASDPAAPAIAKQAPTNAKPAARSGSPATPEQTDRAAGGNASETRSVKVDTAKLDYLVDMVGEMVIAQSLIRHDPDLATVKSPRLLRSVSQATRITAEVQKTAMAMRMLPVGQVFQRMNRLVRDLTRKSGKQAELEISGEETELDRTIVEELADPLMHMVRNSLDHGIETPEERIAAGKPAKAKVILRAYHQGGNILIEVGDDGRGLNREKILKKAKEKKLIEHGDHMADNDVFALIFEPGFSTADQITDISGRGVGMDVVKRQIQKLRGRIDIHSVRGQGTTFFLKLPLTLAIIDGLVVGVGEERYIVPIYAVHESLRPTEEMVSTLPNGSEVVLIRGTLLPVVRLNRKFGIAARSEKFSESLFVICEGQGKRFCIAVDELIGKQEVVIKSLGKIFKNVPGIAGGAILGDGRVGLILDVESIDGKAGNAVA
jgi:two-component system chemotaxis sensor kinase CheA